MISDGIHLAVEIGAMAGVFWLGLQSGLTLCDKCDRSRWCCGRAWLVGPRKHSWLPLVVSPDWERRYCAQCGAVRQRKHQHVWFTSYASSARCRGCALEVRNPPQEVER